MRIDENELSLDGLEKVSGGIRVGGNRCPPPRQIPYYRGPHSGASGTSGDGDTQLGSDGGGPADGGSGGYRGDGNYLSIF